VTPDALGAMDSAEYAGSVISAETAEAFVRWCAATVGLGFHPDTLFKDYYTYPEQQRCFSGDVAHRLDLLLAAAWDYVDVYEVIEEARK
jgi:hypothetical protein